MQLKSFLKPFSILSLLGLISAGSRPALAATTNVSYGSYYFSPSVVQINVGDTVTWTNGLGSHTVQGTGSDPMCGGAYLPCSHTFNTPGTYPYECRLLYHASYGMTGTIIVVAPPPVPALLTNAMWLTNGHFSFTIISTANRTNILQASTNLSDPTNWISLSIMLPSTNTFIFTDTNAGGLPLRFYRVVEPQ
jgi:plastocyanin